LEGGLFIVFEPVHGKQRMKSMGAFHLVLSFLLCCSAWLDVPSCHGFSLMSSPIIQRSLDHRRPVSGQRRFLVDKESSSEDLTMIMGNSELDEEVYQDETSDSTNFYRALQERQDTLKNGIGKRYIARTQKGFLNIHYEPTDPYHTDNIVGQLEEGQVVTSTGHMRGVWIPHDGGGWSISKFGGFTWLEPIDE
jgi:hypothetical protein